jgi:O-methyltransferase
MSDDPLERARSRYIDLLKRSLLGQTYFDNELRILYLRHCLRGEAEYHDVTLQQIRSHRPEQIERIAATIEAGMPIGTDLTNLAFCYTMLGQKRIENLEHCVRTVLRESIPGDLIECGVWRGGAAVLMRGILAAYEARDRKVWVADSFEGLPAPVLAPDLALGLDLSREKFPMLAVDLDSVRRAFSSHGLLDDQVRFLPGWFKDTLPAAPIERLALLRVDGDLYSSTLEALEALYDRVAPGGFVIVDDYFLPNCRQAVDDFIVARRMTEPIDRIDWTGIFWRTPR